MLDEIEALRKAVSQMSKGEVIVCFYEKLKPVQQALKELAASERSSLPPIMILGEVARRVGEGKLVVSTVAIPSNPDGLFEEYEKAFRALGVRHVFKLEINERAEATMESKVRILDDATEQFTLSTVLK